MTKNLFTNIWLMPEHKRWLCFRAGLENDFLITCFPGISIHLCQDTVKPLFVDFRGIRTATAPE